MNDTIAAISTPSGQGAIAIVRLSGPDSFKIIQSLFQVSGSRKPFSITGTKGLHHGWIKSGKQLIDEVLISHFKSPKTYTGEDLIEISCHGSTYIQQEILKLLINEGARMAKPGEFTERAFLNGKMDLTQAEAVADLIASSGAAAHRLAIDQIRGGFSSELALIRTHLLNFVTLIELELDFAEEDVEFADRTRLKNLVNTIIEKISGLVASFELGNAIKSGVPVAIAGETNVGKSTLLNALLKEDKAIVSEIAGTTRDSIEDCIHLGGIEFRFIDTAGIRETTDQIETIGIDRSYRQIEKARIILLVTDATAALESSIRWIHEIITRIRDDQHLVVLVNKSDIDGAKASAFQKSVTEVIGYELSVIMISAKTGDGLKELEEELLHLVNFKSLEDSNVVVTNARHYEALTKAQTALFRTLSGLNMGTSGDFLSQDIREAMHYLGEITGQISTEEILGNIFQHFCIGK
ncbi:MAG: tRNA uridine-5-carboxymethylaminomethyl(34) synthesis GTPase MnmE [Porphyromonadaceae bacterium]|nr:MAG: tRNA uridine-5-carboxymethylaminomethyl(34) synthesis GTPase MnmE [Porphyromonadaceae bacterium]